MAKVEHVTSLILNRGPLREFDRRVVVYTRERGKLLLIAKGTLRITSKLAGSLEPLAEADISLARGRSNRVIGSVILAPWPRLHHELTALAAGNFVAQAVDRLVDVEHADPILYDEFRTCFARLNGEPVDQAGLIVRRCLWRLIDRLGFRPRLDRCVRCGRELGASRVYSPSLGGAVCAVCVKEITDGLAYTDSVTKALDALLDDQGAMQPVVQSVDRDVARFLEATLLAHLESQLPADRFWRAMRQREK